MFYNYAIATTCGVIGGVCMYEKEDYRKMIMEILNDINDINLLIYIFKLAKDIVNGGKNE